jgi:cell division protein FtsI (penicillin-binding protein 3)
MMVAVTEGQATGVEAAIPGFRVAGKTGTAQKADPVTGKYATDRIGASSFVGFVPAERPRIAVVVVLDEPALVHAGGFVAAPAFRRIASMSLRYLGVVSKEGAALAAASPAAASATAARPPIPPALIAPVVADAAEMARIAPSGGPIRLPDLRGSSARQAAKVVFGLGLVPSVQGTGRLSRQEPEPGAMLAPGSTVTLFFQPSS